MKLFRFFKRPKEKPIIERIELKVYYNGTEIIGPVTLKELATIIYYSQSYGEERSIIHIGPAYPKDIYKYTTVDVTAKLYKD